MTSTSSSGSLSPSSPPFIFPRSSPAFTALTGSTSTDTLSSSCVNPNSPPALSSETPKAINNRKEQNKAFPSSLTTTTTAKTFGAGWKSSSPIKMTSTSTSKLDNHQPFLHLPNKGFLPVRSRSPSLPILPSQTPVTSSLNSNNVQEHILYPIDTKKLPNDFEMYSPSSPDVFGHPFSPFIPANEDKTYNNNSIRHQQSLPFIDLELDAQRPNYHRGGPIESPINSIGHQSSLSSLSELRQGLSRQGSGRSVRFQENGNTSFDIHEDDTDFRRSLRKMPPFNLGQLGIKAKLSTSKSMPVIPMVGEGRNVFIHRINNDMSEEDLRIYASDFGDVVSVKIPSRSTRPHAFVMFKRPDQAQNFILHLKMRNIECEFGKEDYQVQNKALEDPNSANMYIAGLPVTITFEELADLMAPGKICSWKPLTDEAGNRRGPIMARLQTRIQANEVIKKINGKYYQGMSERIQARIADSDEQKHFKRHQTMTRDQPLGNSSPDCRLHVDIEDDNDDIGLLTARDHLASQIEAINNQLARTQIKSRNIVFPNQDTVLDQNVGNFATTPIGQIPLEWNDRYPAPKIPADTFHSHFDWNNNWSRGAPLQPGTLPCHPNAGQNRHLSLTSHTEFDSNINPLSALHHTKSSPELGDRIKRSTRA
ncbi:uncharacterized protein L201_001775 [Kwoniella dendrophila CBS 6074]|uniref:RRM domain-containing protein n=1 Tax=Kwoniella dendrophila CBS 6074 TaxID=1295534 RepID=A0AAX4JNA6_9TREE